MVAIFKLLLISCVPQENEIFYLSLHGIYSCIFDDHTITTPSSLLHITAHSNRTLSLSSFCTCPVVKAGKVVPSLGCLFIFDRVWSAKTLQPDLHLHRHLHLSFCLPIPPLQPPPPPPPPPAVTNDCSHIDSEVLSMSSSDKLV